MKIPTNSTNVELRKKKKETHKVVLLIKRSVIRIFPLQHVVSNNNNNTNNMYGLEISEIMNQLNHI